ncbi:hypothetical protein AB0J21_23170 [Streptomyces sp. NPDC049954]|uniref:hypothetical protein n=1 Tax=Streptomyces sp. NPDC049954 TaxID=3155779 RepID=UPI00344204BA
MFEPKGSEAEPAWRVARYRALNGHAPLVAVAGFRRREERLITRAGRPTAPQRTP